MTHGKYKITALTVAAAFSALALLIQKSSTQAADESAKTEKATDAKMTPLERVNSTDKGQLKNPYDYKDKAVAEEGKKIYLKFSCNGCHGGGGGGGMCPPLTNETWVYGGDDDTLYRLITLGSDELMKKDYKRIGQETVVGPMPPYKDIIKDEEQMWKIIAYIRTVWGGRDKKIEW